MGFFNYTSKVKPKTFTYNPIYYDAEKERREKLFKNYDEKHPNAMKSRISTGLKRGSMYYEKPSVSKHRKASNIRVLLIAVILLIAIIYVISENLESILTLGQ